MSGKWLVAVVIACWIGVGCSGKSGVPRGILPLEKMEQLVWDMAQADQFAAIYVSRDSAHVDRKEETMRLYEEVFRLHGVTRDEFRKSYQYYLDHPALNQILFDSVMVRGSRARTEMYDRPSTYRPPVAVRPNVEPAGPGKRGMPLPFVPGRPVVVPPGGASAGGSGVAPPVRPGALVPGMPAGPAGDAIRRVRENMARRQDSLGRARHLKRDTTPGQR